MNITSNNLVNAVEELVSKGYSHDFRLGDDQLFDVTAGSNIEADGFVIDEAFRFEASPGSDDCSNLFAISTLPDGTRGLLIDAFDLHRQKLNALLTERLNLPPIISKRDNLDDGPMKYGMRKIFKSHFNEESERYVLRKGFPDFPDCPFGQEFSMLGYDKRNERYVWLVTSILKDDRLATETYQN